MGEPNDALRAARERVESPHATGLSLSRMELAELANEKVYFETGRVIELSANYVGKLERGLVRWPNADYRAGLRAALGARTDAELGFRRPSRSRTTVVDVDRKDFLRAAIGIGATSIANGPLADLVASAEPAPVPSIVGVTEIEQVSATARVFSELDRSYGGGLLREAMTAQLRHAVALLDVRCSQRDRGDLFSAVGDLGHRAGLMTTRAAGSGSPRPALRRPTTGICVPRCCFAWQDKPFGAVTPTPASPWWNSRWCVLIGSCPASARCCSPHVRRRWQDCGAPKSQSARSVRQTSSFPLHPRPT
jgi:hypothetical protein